MKSIRCTASHRRDRIFICTKEITDIHQQPEVRMRYCVDKLFHPAGILTKLSVIFHHGTDSFLGCIFGYCQAAFY